MAAHDYLEDLSSLLPAITLLEKLGFTYLTPSEQLALRGGRTSKCLLESVLSPANCKNLTVSPSRARTIHLATAISKKRCKRWRAFRSIA